MSKESALLLNLILWGWPSTMFVLPAGASLTEHVSILQTTLHHLREKHAIWQSTCKQRQHASQAEGAYALSPLRIVSSASSALWFLQSDG
jgi:hypothetical protein